MLSLWQSVSESWLDCSIFVVASSSISLISEMFFAPDILLHDLVFLR